MHFKVVVGEDILDIIEEFEGENEKSDDESDEKNDKNDDVLEPQVPIKSMKLSKLKSKSESKNINPMSGKDKNNNSNKEKKNSKNLKIDSTLANNENMINEDDDPNAPDKEIERIFSTDSFENLQGKNIFLLFLLIIINSCKFS